MGEPLGSVIVTGGSSGLGAAVTSVVNEAGGTSIVLDVQQRSSGVEHRVVDLSDGRATEAAVADIVREHPDLRAVVCAAGIDACGSLEAIDAAAWERVIAVNLLGTVAVVRAAMPALTRNHGRVVTVASTLGLRALPDATAYCASKFGVVGFTRALAAETAGRLGVTLLVPGGMHTAFFDGRPDQYRPAADARLNQPENVAAAVLFALQQPPGCEVRELVVCPETETSWP
jgi:NAD(P)-dependent dehydrogenase (short-subunit alcohol dehydrogenase family)